MIDQALRIKVLKNKVVSQNIAVKFEIRFTYNEEHFVIVRLGIGLLIFMRSTAERDNLTRLHGWGMPYTYLTCVPSKFRNLFVMLIK